MKYAFLLAGASTERRSLNTMKTASTTCSSLPDMHTILPRPSQTPQPLCYNSCSHPITDSHPNTDYRLQYSVAAQPRVIAMILSNISSRVGRTFSRRLGGSGSHRMPAPRMLDSVLETQTLAPLRCW